ncbi:hypothetical protein DFO55_1375 [Grimontella sp. AG753]|nr:hypothetical protein DFO55_1375 [Grimontella sp. AG753]
MDNIPNEYFLNTDDDLLAFLEKQGEESIKEIEKANDANRESGYKLLNILILGIGSSFLLLTQNKQPEFMSIGLGVFTLYWTVCAIYLVLRVLSIQLKGLISSPPAVLYNNTYRTLDSGDFEYFRTEGFKGSDRPLDVIRRIRLKNLELNAQELLRNNVRIRTELERVRIATILTPVLALTVSVIAYLSS